MKRSGITHACATVALLALGGTALAAPSVQVIDAVRHDTSRPLRDILAELPAQPAMDPANPYVVPNLFPKEQANGSAIMPDVMEGAYENVQRAPTGSPAPATIVSANGLSLGQGGNGIPPDTNGDVSPAHYIQWVNTSWALFDKVTGLRIGNFTAGNSFFAGFGGRCQTTNAGDPLAIWDDKAQRWVMSQFTTPLAGNAASQCVAISTTSDPLGTYHRYEFPSAAFGDYPHIGIWESEAGGQNAYLMVTHEFNLVPQQAFLGAAFIAFDRDRMLQGLSATAIRFGGFDAYGAEPAHLEGTVKAPGRSCPVFVHFDANTSEYLLWDLCVNFATPASSTVSANPQRLASGTPFAANFDAVPQLGSTVPLDSFGTHIMYRASTRAFPAGAPLPMTMAVTNSVKTGLTSSGVRWTQFRFDQADVLMKSGFEDAEVAVLPTLRKSIHDEGVYAPDNDNRWMGGIAVDRSGGIGLGYSVGGATINPKLKITARTLELGDGLMLDEQFCSPTTTGSQTGSFDGRGRWGDYASMSVDPVDECTYWFTSEYYATTSTQNWTTRICSFKNPSCGAANFDVVADSAKRVQLCAATGATDPTFALRVGVLDGFNTSTALTASGFPGGVTAQFSPASGTPPYASTLTLQGAAALASGEYSGTVTATAAAATRTLPLSVGVSSAVTAAAPLLSPTNNQTGVKVRPTLSWTAVPGAVSYTVQIATDAAFTNIVASDTVTTTTWASTVGLAPLTQFRWRVRTNNYCGTTNSATFVFTTGTPGTCPSGTTISTVFQDDFQGGVNGWTTDGTGGTQWAQGIGQVGSGLLTTTWTIPNNIVTSDRGLISPNVAIPAGAQAAILSFDAWSSFETDGPTGCWDGAAVEARIGAGAFNYLAASTVFTNPYDGTITAGAPLAGRQVWCHVTSPTPARTVVDLDAYIGQTINLKWRATTDSNTAAQTPTTGMAIDNLKVEICQ